MRLREGQAAPFLSSRQEQNGVVRPPQTGTAPTLANTPRFSPYATETALRRGGQEGYFDWLDHVWAAAGCSHPVRLSGELATVSTSTGEILSTVPTLGMPDGLIYKACGNRRSTVCPACSDVYRRDAYQIIRSGLVGGKGVPESVASHPAVFPTFTAPSFGAVHTRHVRRHSCRDKARCSCRPEPCHARRQADSCQHGATQACFIRHDLHDPDLGQPLCLDCYDHDAHVVWNQQAGELWRRTKQAIQRHINQLARQRGLPNVRVSHGKAAEYQNRGAVHFHALLRLDGIDETDPDALIAPPVGLTAADLVNAVDHAVATISYRTDEHLARPPGGWRIGWGDQCLTRVVTLSGDNPVTDGMVAGYLAKYSTKGTEITGHSSRRLTPSTIRLYADPAGSHTERLVQAAWDLGGVPDWEGLRRWAHMLGFGGHFLTKGRRYSIVFRALRDARITYRRTESAGPDHDAEAFERQDHLDTETTLIVGRLTYAGTGWRTTGDALLANTAADQARKRRETGREELAHMVGGDLAQTIAA